MLSGEAGHDKLYGGPESDRLFGGDGDDLLVGESAQSEEELAELEASGNHGPSSGQWD